MTNRSPRSCPTCIVWAMNGIYLPCYLVRLHLLFGPLTIVTTDQSAHATPTSRLPGAGDCAPADGSPLCWATLVWPRLPDLSKRHKGDLMLGAIFQIARPLLFTLDPEHAHELTLKSLE